jgi:hypothetical protein
MFITKMSLPRRTFLRGMGVAVALPFMEAMVPAVTATAKSAANPKLRFGAVYVPNGIIMDQWTPVAGGVGLDFKPVLSALEPFRDSMVVVSNLARPGLEATANHAPTAAGWLSGVVAKRTEAEDFHLGTTIDQIVAKQISQDTPFPSLELATEDFTGYVGGCAPGYSCAYMNTISWSTPTTPLPMEINPRVVFERMFGRAGTSAQRLARMKRDRSILDAITNDASELQSGLGSRDRARLDEYLTDIREIERRIQRAEAQTTTQVMPLDAPVGVPDSFEEHVGLMFDLLAVAYQTDLTRVFTFMMAREASNKTYPQIGIPDPHHSLSHHGNKPEKIADYAKLNAHHVRLFASFIGKLRATPDGDGTLLDHSLICYGSGMSNGNGHTADPLPFIALGGGVGRGDRHVRSGPKTPIGNVWLAIANKFGSPIDSFGESTGPVDVF